MKNAKKVLFVMILSAPLSIFSMEGSAVASSVNNNSTGHSVSPIATPPVSPKACDQSLSGGATAATLVDSSNGQSVKDIHIENAKRLGFTSAVLGVSTGLSVVFAPQSDARIVKAQYVGVAATVTTAAMATREALKANPNAVNDAKTSLNNATISLKNLCTVKKDEKKELPVVEPVVPVSPTVSSVAGIAEETK